MSRFAPITVLDESEQLRQITGYKYGWSDDGFAYSYRAPKGLTEEVVREISRQKQEPEWMLAYRLQGLKTFLEKPMPNWGADLSGINFDEIHYYLRPTDQQGRTWEDVPAEIKRTFERLGIPEAERKFLAGVKSQYDCLTADSMVFMDSGVKKIVDILPGEFVYALNEETYLLERQRVLGLAEKGARQVYKVITQGGREIKVTENHPFLSLQHSKNPGKRRGRYKKQWMYLSDLKVGDLVALTTQIPDHGKPYTLPAITKPKAMIQSRNQFGTYLLDISNWYANVIFPLESNEDLMWLLGFYLGDGFLSGKGKHSNNQYMRVDLAIPAQEEQLRSEVIRVVKTLFNYDLIVSKKDRVTLNSALFVQMIQKLGFNGLAHTKRIPAWVFTLPMSQRLAFIGGYFDADGSIRKMETHKNLVFTSVCKDLLADLKILGISCGLNPSHIWSFSSKQKYKDKVLIRSGYRLQLSGAIWEVGSRMDRKRSLFGRRKFIHRFNSAQGTVFRKHVSEHMGFAKILSIESLGMEPVYDIEVEGYHNFVANGLIVHNSEVVYGSLLSKLSDQGVIFLGMDEGLKQYPELVEEYFASIIPVGDNKFAALNTAVWSGGSFIYVPRGVEVELPLQAYFRINSAHAGQFERTLIIVDEGAKVHYVEGCSAPAYTEGSLHSAVVEIAVKAGARCQYTTIQNWYTNVYNLVTKRSKVYKDAKMFWIDGNLGSRTTMKYPSCILVGERAHGEILSIAFAGKGQHQDAGGKVIHIAPNTTSQILSKSISKDGGRATYRGMVHISPTAKHSKSKVVCDALILDADSRSDTYPVNKIFTEDVSLEHEATVSKIGEEQLFYLMSRGLSEEQANAMIVSGFIEPIVKDLPMEYAVELNRLIELEMEGSVG